ncbi:glutamyl-tRNA reductase [Leucobacter massiliensis]|uniref:Glutamyl-tRNA reductase n=1 Tax=Leucobacter massiliensis TaxID=1686285 RepID=A0A2S9QLS2_9MICO|nr:glutamyl-tRNA reductase [Leucobacter massiliensis]PRI10538.1 glutamyl-tRNA reductase [Leucobacter massiliensis]
MLLCLSVDHRHADLALLERIERRLDSVTAALSDGAMSRGAVVLATCNRFEAYLDAPGLAPERALDGLAQAAGMAPEELDGAVSVHRGDEVAAHLFAVSSGLESAAVGEGEIAGQVRRAIDAARSTGTSTTELERLFQHAAVVSKRVKHRTGLQRKGRSLVQLALAMVDSRVGDWTSARVLLIGTGAYAGASLAALRTRGARHIGVYSPSGRAEAFAASHGIRPVPAGALDAELRASDLVVACSSVHEPLLTRERFDETVTAGSPPFCARFPGLANGSLTAAAAPTRPRLLIDMGLPRNISPDVTGVPGVELLDLETIALHAPIPELGAELEARDIVRTAAAEFAAVRAEREAVPALRELRAYVDGILSEEIARMRRRGAAGAPGTDATTGGDARSDELEAALRHLTGRLLHRPSVRLRELARQGRASEGLDAVTALFAD